MTQDIADQLSAVLAERSHDVDGSVPRPGIRTEAAAIHRQRALAAMAGVAAVVAAAIALPVLVPVVADRATPPAVGPGVLPVDVALRQVSEGCGCAVAAGLRIDDGSTGRSILVTGPGGRPLSADHTIAQVYPAGAGYVVVMATPVQLDAVPRGTVAYVAEDGRLHALGRTTADQFGYARAAVSSDGRLVAFVSQDEGSGRPRVVVTDTSGRVVHQHRLTDPLQAAGRVPMTWSVSTEGVWFQYAGPGSGSPSYWDFASASPSHVPGDGNVSGRFLAGRGSLVWIQPGGARDPSALYDEASSIDQGEVWRGAPAVDHGAFDQAGGYLLGVRGSTVVLVDAGTGAVLDETTLTGPVWIPQPIGPGRWGVLSAGEADVVRAYRVSVSADRTLEVAEAEVPFPSDVASLAAN